MDNCRFSSFHAYRTIVTILIIQVHLCCSFLTGRLDFSTRRRHRYYFMSSEDDDELPLEVDELSAFEKDLLEAFGTNENRDDALTNAAYTAFARDLRNVGDWDDDTSDNDFLVDEVEAFEIYTETYNDMGGETNFESVRTDVSDEERKLIDEIVASTKIATSKAHEKKESASFDEEDEI